MSRLERFAELLRERAVPLGLIAASDADRIAERHVDDSLRAVGCLRPTDIHLIDLGAGAGLPGIPIAIAEPGRHVVLLEPTRKRAAFLELAVERLGLRNAEVLMARAEDVDLDADACLARALAPPARSWELASPLLRPHGRLLYFAGRSWSSSDQARLELLGVRAEACSAARFAWQGPVVIMARTSQ